MTLLELFEEAEEARKKTESIAKPLYEDWHNKLTLAIEKAFKTKKGQEVCGLLKAPIRFKFKDGTVFELRPAYMSKQGDFKNGVFKWSAGEVFNLNKVEKPLPF